MLKNLWHDEVGALLSAEFTLLATILVVGAIVGLKAAQEAVVTELTDVGQAFSNVNQTYNFAGTTGPASYTGGSQFGDDADFSDINPSTAGRATKRTAVVTAASAE